MSATGGVNRCLKAEVDVGSKIERQGTVLQCRTCLRWQKPGNSPRLPSASVPQCTIVEFVTERCRFEEFQILISFALIDDIFRL